MRFFSDNLADGSIKDKHPELRDLKDALLLIYNIEKHLNESNIKNYMRQGKNKFIEALLTIFKDYDRADSTNQAHITNNSEKLIDIFENCTANCKKYAEALNCIIHVVSEGKPDGPYDNDISTFTLKKRLMLENNSAGDNYILKLGFFRNVNEDNYDNFKNFIFAVIDQVKSKGEWGIKSTVPALDVDPAQEETTSEEEVSIGGRKRRTKRRKTKRKNTIKHNKTKKRARKTRRYRKR